MTVRVRFEWVLCLPGSFSCVCRFSNNVACLVFSWSWQCQFAMRAIFMSVVDVKLILQIYCVCLQAFRVLVLQYFSVALPVLGLRRVCVFSRCPARSKNRRRRQPQQMSSTMHREYRGLYHLQRFRGLHLVSCPKLEKGGERFECLWHWLEAEIKDTVLTIDVSVLYFVNILPFYAKLTKAVNETGAFVDGGNPHTYVYVK